MPRALKAGVAAAVLVGLLVVVALGARGSHPGAHYATHQRQVPAQVGDDLLTFAIVAYGIGLLILIAAFLAFRHEWVTPRSRWLRDFFVMLTVLCFLTVIGYHFFHNRPLRHAQHGQPSAHTGFPLGTDPRSRLPQLAGPKQSAHFDWRFASVLAGLAVLTASFFLLRGGPAEPAEEGVEVEEDLRAVVSDAIDDLQREPDARRAVIAAYARMETVLGRHGRARRAAEAPYEYLERVLGDLRIRPVAVHDLTDLFERAKFSVQQIDSAMKARAIDAFVAVREDLRRT
jgi:Domain of unknown function (DUF4129)